MCAASSGERASTSMILLLTARTGGTGESPRPRARRRRLRDQAVQPERAARADQGHAAAQQRGAADIERSSASATARSTSAARELRRDGKPVATTPLEFKLLALFARRAGRVLTRRAVIDEAWGKDTAITERVVDNQVANLRKKIEPEPAAPRFLKSVRGIGYRFDLEEVTES